MYSKKGVRKSKRRRKTGTLNKRFTKIEAGLRTDLSIKKANTRTGGFLGIEKKFLDTFLDAGNLNAEIGAVSGEHDPVGIWASFNGMQTGTGESDRDGRQIIMDSLYITGMIWAPSVTGTIIAHDSPAVFIAVVLDKQTNGVKLNSEDVYKNTSGQAEMAAYPVRNLQHIKRFRVLKTLRITIPQRTYFGDAVSGDMSGVAIPFECYTKLNGMKTNYKGTTANISEIVDNSLHLIAWSSTLFATFPYNISYNARLRFYG